VPEGGFFDMVEHPSIGDSGTEVYTEEASDNCDGDFPCTARGEERASSNQLQ